MTKKRERRKILSDSKSDKIAKKEKRKPRLDNMSNTICI